MSNEWYLGQHTGDSGGDWTDWNRMAPDKCPVNDDKSSNFDSPKIL